LIFFTFEALKTFVKIRQLITNYIHNENEKNLNRFFVPFISAFMGIVAE
jgi:hypothetical protein